MNSTSTLREKIRTLLGAGANKQPLTSQHAYALSSIGKKKSMDELLEHVKKDILATIEHNAKFNHTKTLIDFPEWLCDAHREAIKVNLTTLGYTILYHDKECMLVSWKIKLLRWACSGFDCCILV